MKDTRVSLRINEELKEYLETLAECNNLSVSEVIRNILDENLHEDIENDFELKSLERKATKIKNTLSKSNWIYLEGLNTTAEIKFDDFKIDAFIMQNDSGIKGTPLIRLELFMQEELIFVMHISNENKIEIHKVLEKEHLFISKL